MNIRRHLALVLACSLPLAHAEAQDDAEVPPCTKAVLVTALALNPDLNRLAINVAVRGDAAVLEGVVRSDFQSELATRIAAAVPGVLSVENRLVIRRDTARNLDLPPIARAMLDATIVARVESQLHWSSATRHASIEVASNYGRVNLSGSVPSQAARDWAERVADSTYDVTSVINGLEVSAPDDEAGGDDEPTDSEITAMVTRMLHFNRLVDDTHMEISTVNGKVSIYGRVPTEMQRELAGELAGAVVGVEALVVELEV